MELCLPFPDPCAGPAAGGAEPVALPLECPPFGGGPRFGSASPLPLAFACAEGRIGPDPAGGGKVGGTAALGPPGGGWTGQASPMTEAEAVPKGGRCEGWRPPAGTSPGPAAFPVAGAAVAPFPRPGVGLDFGLPVLPSPFTTVFKVIASRQCCVTPVKIILQGYLTSTPCLPKMSVQDFSGGVSPQLMSA